MQRSEFEALLESEFKRILELNRTKGHEYAGDDDALSNFKDMAKNIGLTSEQVWAVYAGKHWSSILSYVREGQVHSEPIEERVRDLTLYCLLLLGLLQERNVLLAPDAEQQLDKLLKTPHNELSNSSTIRIDVD